MRRALASLILLLALLLCFAGTASGAYVDATSKNRVGVPEQNPNIRTYVLGSLELEPQRGDTILGYDPATGVVFYVNQNPWTHFDPLGLETKKGLEAGIRVRENILKDETLEDRHPKYAKQLRSEIDGLSARKERLEQADQVRFFLSSFDRDWTEGKEFDDENAQDSHAIQDLLEIHKAGGKAWDSVIGMGVGAGSTIATRPQQLNRLLERGPKALADAVKRFANNAASGVSNPVPTTMARVVDARFVSSPNLGGPGATDVFVTAARDIRGITSSQALANRLTLLDNAGNLRQGPFGIIEFSTPASGVASPVFRSNPGFMQGGLTGGGAREFVLPNMPVNQLQGVTTRIVP